MTCPLWNGQDSFGRFVHPDSFVTKNAGCNSADDRVSVENYLRPQYMEYVALDAAGFRSPSVFNEPQHQPHQPQMHQTQMHPQHQPQHAVEHFTAYPRGEMGMAPDQTGIAQYHTQFNLDANYANQDSTNNIPSITGSAGFQYSANNTVRDLGLNGVWPNRGLACGRRVLKGAYAPDMRYQQNMQNRAGQVAYVGDYDNSQHQHFGF